MRKTQRTEEVTARRRLLRGE